MSGEILTDEIHQTNPLEAANRSLSSIFNLQQEIQTDICLKRKFAGVLAFVSESMVNCVKGVLVTCDPAMKQFLLHLDEKQAFGKKFILLNLDDTHLFISADIVETLQSKFDDLMDRISFPVHERGD